MISPRPFWDSTPIGNSVYLRLCQQLSPELILEDKVFRSAIRLLNNSTYHSQIQFIGTLIIDDESQRLTYVIDRLKLTDSTTNVFNNHQLLSGEFLIPIQCDNKNSSAIKTLVQDGIKVIDAYCRSSSPIELHQFSYLYGQMSSRLSSSANADLSFDLLTIKTSFLLTPINRDYVQILPTALLKDLYSATGNSIYINQPHFGYCTLDQMSKNRIVLIPENDPQICVLPLVGIWISGVSNVQCAFVWAACLRYCFNSSLKQRLRTGINSQQSFLLACYLSTSPIQCDFYEVNLITNNSKSSLTVDYDLWTCPEKIIMPNSPSHQYDTSSSTHFPYGFEFKHVYDGPKMYALLNVHPGNSSSPIQHQTNQFPTGTSLFSSAILSDDNQAALSSPNTNGSLFGIPRLPPKQSTYQSPSWNSLSTPTMTTPRQTASAPLVLSPLTDHRGTVRVSSTTVNDAQSREELIERMYSYEVRIQSLTDLLAQVLETQKQQQSLISTRPKECTTRDVAVQSDLPSLCTHDNLNESASMIISNRHSQYQQRQATCITTSDTSSSIQFQALPQQEPVTNYASLGKSTEYERLTLENTPVQSLPPMASTDLNPVDILKPFFQFMAHQQQKQRSVSPLIESNNEESGYTAGTTSHLTNDNQQHVTSTRTTGISFVSNGLQMQFINQESSTTTVYPPPPAPLPQGLISKSSPNNLSMEVRSLEMKYLEDDQLAVAIECDRQSITPLKPSLQSPQIFDKTMSFGTQEYFQKYGIFKDKNPRQELHRSSDENNL